MQQADVLVYSCRLVKVWRPAAWLLFMEPEKLRTKLLEAVDTLQHSTDQAERETAANQIRFFIDETL